jgi:hypothetical protein
VVRRFPFALPPFKESARRYRRAGWNLSIHFFEVFFFGAGFIFFVLQQAMVASLGIELP